MNSIIIEDSPNRSQLLQTHIYKRKDVKLIKIFQDFEGLINMLGCEKVGPVFLSMENFSDHQKEYLEKITPQPYFVLHKLANQSNNFSSGIQIMDFLNDPIDAKRFDFAISKAKLHFEALYGLPENKGEQLLRGRFFFVKADYKILKIDIDSIEYIEGLGEYIRICTTDQKIVTLLSMSKLMGLLPIDRFVRIHRSTIINLEKINFIQNNIVSIGRQQLNISKSRKKELINLISKYGVN